MEISKEQFFIAADNQGIPQDRIEALWKELENKEKAPRVSAFSKMLFYFGAMIIIAAMTWLMDLAWEWFGGGGIFLISVIYAIVFIFLGAKLWERKDLKIPAGLFVTIAVCMTPLAIYGLQTYFGLWPGEQPEKYIDFFSQIKSSWILMEAGTIIAGLIALIFFPFPFITAPIFFAAWFLTMDIIPLLLGKESSWEQKEWISLCFGLILIYISYMIDRRKKEDYAFWGYLFGTLTFWGSLTGILWNKGEFFLFVYFLINFMMLVFSILLRRKVLMVFGGIGSFIYLSHLAYEIFANSILFPFVLSFIGLAIVFLGILYQKNIRWIEAKIAEIIPSGIRKLFPFEEND